MLFEDLPLRSLQRGTDFLKRLAGGPRLFWGWLKHPYIHLLRSLNSRPWPFAIESVG